MRCAALNDGPYETVSRLRLETVSTRAPFELREVDVGERLLDQPALVGLGERLARDLLGGDQAEPADLVADLAERLVRRLVDLAPRLLEPPLPVGLGLLADALALRVGDAARLGQDLLGLRLRLAEQLAVLLEQVARLGARVVGLLDRLADPLAPLVDRLLDRPERPLLQDDEDDDEEGDRPDHQAGDDLRQGARRPHDEARVRHPETSTKPRKPPTSP